ncbi:hypothetical protein [Hoyosella altamirensis]|uniref:Uncharacterized protein n=1 Tax=Hoyosella altamirensis TaxID=616997 RepID=A0A839RRX2_9ACTN|nr:hypothetical protein [Hoyosella altamirensis]MBB3039605.1 hypothetical protein [Hoyosella altamirensis]
MGTVLGIAVDARHLRSALRYPDGSCDEQTVPVGSEGIGNAVATAVSLMQEWAGPIRSVVVASPNLEPIQSIEDALGSNENRVVQFVDLAAAQWAYLLEIGVFIAPGDVILYSLGDNSATVSIVDPESGETLARDYHPYMGQRAIDLAIQQVSGSRHRVDEIRRLLTDRATANVGGVTVHRTDVTARLASVAEQSFQAALQLAQDAQRDVKSIYLIGSSAVLLAPIARNYRSVPIIVPEDPGAVAAIGAASLVTAARAAEQTGTAPASGVAVVKAARVSGHRRPTGVYRRSPNSRKLIAGAAVIALFAGIGLGVHLAATSANDFERLTAPVSDPDPSESAKTGSDDSADSAPNHADREELAPLPEAPPPPPAPLPAPPAPPQPQPVEAPPYEPVAPPAPPPPPAEPPPAEPPPAEPVEQPENVPGREEAAQPVAPEVEGSQGDGPDGDASETEDETNVDDEPDSADEDVVTEVPLGF